MSENHVIVACPYSYPFGSRYELEEIYRSKKHLYIIVLGIRKTPSSIRVAFLVSERDVDYFFLAVFFAAILRSLSYSLSAA